MKSQKLTKWVAALLLLIGLTAAGFVLGRMTGADSEGDGNTSGTSVDREVLYWRAPMDPTEIYDAPGQSRMGMDLVPVYADEQATGGKTTGKGEILYWRAPMDPTEIYDSPGKSKMGMDLVPVYEGESEAESDGVIKIDPATVQNMGVRTSRVEKTDFSRTIRTVGEVEYDEERLYIVNSKVAGWIEKLYVNFVGEQVRKGAPLMEIYSPELVSTQQEYLLAVKNYETATQSGIVAVEQDAERLLRSARKRLEYWDIPSSFIEQLERTGEVKKTILLHAPATGIVVKRNAIDGAFISAGMDLFEIADLRSVWVHASLYDNEIPWVSEGQKVEMELSYLPGKTYSGRVSYVYPYLREEARDVHVRLIFSNPNLDLKPGMYANVRLQGRVIPDAVVVPTEAVIRSGTRNIVFVVRGEGRFEPREIRIGEEGGLDNCCLRVISGLLGGEEVVVSAQFMIDSESRLQEAIQKMLAERTQSSAAMPKDSHLIPDSKPAERAPEMQKTESTVRSGDSTPAMEYDGHDMQNDDPMPAEEDTGHDMRHDDSTSSMDGVDHDMQHDDSMPTMEGAAHDMQHGKPMPAMDDAGHNMQHGEPMHDMESMERTRKAPGVDSTRAMPLPTPTKQREPADRDTSAAPADTTKHQH